MSFTLNNDAFYRGYLTKTAETAPPRSPRALDSYTPTADNERSDYVPVLDRPSFRGAPQGRPIDISSLGGQLKYMMPWVSKDRSTYMSAAPLTPKSSSTPGGNSITSGSSNKMPWWATAGVAGGPASAVGSAIRSSITSEPSNKMPWLATGLVGGLAGAAGSEYMSRPKQ